MAEDARGSSKDPKEVVRPYLLNMCMVGGGGSFKGRVLSNLSARYLVDRLRPASCKECPQAGLLGLGQIYRSL